MIATILIIGFTVALAAVIMTWGQSFVKLISEGTEASTNEQLVCANEVLFEIQDACIYVPIGKENSTVVVTVANNGKRNINYFSARYYFGSSLVKANYLAGLNSLAIQTMTNETNIGKQAPPLLVKRVELTAFIKIDEKIVACPGEASAGAEDLADNLNNCP